MENTFKNALKYVRKLDADDEGWSESENTLALYMSKYAEMTIKNDSFITTKSKCEYYNDSGAKPFSSTEKCPLCS